AAERVRAGHRHRHARGRGPAVPRAKGGPVMKAKAKKKRAPAKRAPAKKVVNPIPAGHPALPPYLIVDDAPRALEVYKTAFGHQWHISTHVEDVSLAELRRRAAQMGH